MTQFLTSYFTIAAEGTRLRHVAGGPALLGRRRDATARRLLVLPHRPRPLPARGAHLPHQGPLPLLHGGGEPGLRDGHRQTGGRGGAEGAQEGHRRRQQRQPAPARPRDQGEQQDAAAGGVRGESPGGLRQRGVEGSGFQSLIEFKLNET